MTSKYSVFIELDPDDDQQALNSKRMLELKTIVETNRADENLVREYINAMRIAADNAELTDNCLDNVCCSSDSHEVIEKGDDVCCRLHRYEQLTKKKHDKYTLDELLSLLVVLHEFDCPTSLLGYLSSAAFAKLNALSTDERRERIGMGDDRYGEETDLVRQVAILATKDAVKQASGTFCDDVDKNKINAADFEWPTIPSTTSADE